MIVSIVLSIIFSFVLSQPDLCRNPKLDSIAWIPPLKMWFFTSGGYYWYMKDEFPPGPPSGKLPEGFSRGDGAFFADLLNVCKKVPNARQTKNMRTDDQLIYVVEKTNDGNQILQYDPKTQSNPWSQSHSLKSDRVIGRSYIEDPEGKIDAMFGVGDSDVFLVQEKKFAGVNWLNLCSNPEGYSKAYPTQNTDDLMSSRGSYDAITVKDNQMYLFIGNAFWTASIDFRNQRLTVAKSEEKNVSSKFFKFKDCPAVQPLPPNEDSKPSAVDSKDKDVADPNKSPDNSKDSKESTKSSVVSVIFLILIVIAIDW